MLQKPALTKWAIGVGAIALAVLLGVLYGVQAIGGAAPAQTPTPPVRHPPLPTFPPSFRPPTLPPIPSEATIRAMITPRPAATREPTRTPGPCDTPVTAGATWTRYTMPDKSFSFEYPANWSVVYESPVGKAQNPIGGPLVFVMNVAPECTDLLGFAQVRAGAPPWVAVVAGSLPLVGPSGPRTNEVLIPRVGSDGRPNTDFISRFERQVAGSHAYLTTYRDAFRPSVDQAQLVVVGANRLITLRTYYNVPGVEALFERVIQSLEVTR